LTILVRPQDAGGSTPAAVADHLRARLARDPLVAVTSLDPVGASVIVVGQLKVDPESTAAVEQLVPRVRSWVGGRGLVSGLSAFNFDLNTEGGKGLWKSMPLVLGLALLLMLVLV